MIDKFIKGLRIILILIFFVWGVSWISVKAHHKELKDRNFIEKLVVDAGNYPPLIRQWFNERFNKTVKAHKIALDENTYRIGEFPKDSKINDSLFLLYYNYLGDNKGKVFLKNIKSGETAYSWNIPLERIIEDLNKLSSGLSEKYFNDSLSVNLSLKIKKNIPSIHITAPIITNDTSLIFSSGNTPSYMYKIDKKSKLLWKSKNLVHHSIQLDNEGNIWTCSIDLKHKDANYKDYREDALLCMGLDGKVKSFKSLTDIFKANNLYKELIGSSPNYKQSYGLDPYHLNDVLPVNKNGKYWQKGDLFLSLRNKSLVLLYRPSKDSIIWYQKGPWLGQHDINIVNDSTISIFNNNIWFFKSHNTDSKSNIGFYNFSKNNVEFKFDTIFHSAFEGRQSQIPGGGIIIEATGESLYYILDSIGTVKGKFYIPYYSNPNNAMYPSWARVYLKKDNKFIIP